MFARDKNILEELKVDKYNIGGISFGEIVVYHKQKYEKFSNNIGLFTDLVNKYFGIDNNYQVKLFTLSDKVVLKLNEKVYSGMIKKFKIFNNMEIILPGNISVESFSDFCVDNGYFLLYMMEDFLDKEILLHNTMCLPSVNNNFILGLNNGDLRVIYNYRKIKGNIDYSCFENLSYKSLLTIGVDFFDESENFMPNEFCDYYFWCNNIVRNTIYRKHLEHGVYCNQEINPFEAIKFNENWLPITMKEKIRSHILK